MQRSHNQGFALSKQCTRNPNQGDEYGMSASPLDSHPRGYPTLANLIYSHRRFSSSGDSTLHPLICYTCKTSWSDWRKGSLPLTWLSRGAGLLRRCGICSRGGRRLQLAEKGAHGSDRKANRKFLRPTSKQMWQKMRCNHKPVIMFVSRDDTGCATC